MEVLNDTKTNRARDNGVSLQDEDQLFAIAARDLCPAGNASGSSESSGSACNSADCVPNITQNAVLGGPCTIGTRYVFGLDANGNTLICTSYSAGYTQATGIEWKGHWSSAPPLIGVRDQGSSCSGTGVAAQSPDETPMICENQVWTSH